MIGNSISISDIAPTVLFCHLFPDDYGLTLENFPKLPLRRTYDYELEIYLTDGGHMLLGNEHLALQRGSVILRCPGYQTQALDPFRCYSVIVDMTGKSGKSRESYNHKAPQQVQVNCKNQLLDCIQPLTVSTESERLIHLFEKIYKEFNANWPHSPIILRSYVLEILYILYADAVAQHEPLMVHPIQYHKAVHISTQYVNLNFAKKLSLHDIASYVDLSAYYFSRLFMKCMGMNLSTYIMSVRLQKAKELILYTNLHIGEVANLCGFESQTYFISAFNRHFQMTPGRFRTKYT